MRKWHFYSHFVHKLYRLYALLLHVWDVNHDLISIKLKEIVCKLSEKVFLLSEMWLFYECNKIVYFFYRNECNNCFYMECVLFLVDENNEYLARLLFHGGYYKNTNI